MSEKKQKQDFYEIDKIMGKKMENNKMFFLVKWKGYANKHNTWEPIENFVDIEFLHSKIDQFDHNVQRISSKHKKLKEYRENMSIEEESEEEYDEEGKARKFVMKKISPKKKNRKPSKKSKKIKTQTTVKYYPQDDNDEEYIPEEEMHKFYDYEEAQKYMNKLVKKQIKQNHKYIMYPVKNNTQIQYENFYDNKNNTGEKRKRKSQRKKIVESPILSFEELTEFPKRRLQGLFNKNFKNHNKQNNIVDMSETTVEKSTNRR